MRLEIGMKDKISYYKDLNSDKEWSGAEILRLIVRNMDTTKESFNDQFSVEELVQIYSMQLASEWDFYPDEWTKRQVKEALRGIVPKWKLTKSGLERPVYKKNL